MEYGLIVKESVIPKGNDVKIMDLGMYIQYRKFLNPIKSVRKTNRGISDDEENLKEGRKKVRRSF